MTRSICRIALWSLIFCSSPVRADDPSHSGPLALLEFLRSEPILAIEWPTVPKEFMKANELPSDIRLGLFLCPLADVYLRSCRKALHVTPFSEILSISRVPKLDDADPEWNPGYSDWTVELKTGERRVALSTTLPPAVFSGAPERAGEGQYFGAKRWKIKPQVELNGSTGFVTRIPIYSFDPATGKASYRTVELDQLASLRLVARDVAPAALEQAMLQYEQAQLARQLVITERRRVAELKKRAAQEMAENFRKTLKPGDRTHCGMVIEIRSPIVQIQSPHGLVWQNIDQIFPPGERRCIIDIG